VRSNWPDAHAHLGENARLTFRFHAHGNQDSSGQKLGCFYYEEEPGRRSAAKLLTKDEARRIAVNFAKLPEQCRCQ
jgi:hypothetical protein